MTASLRRGACPGLSAPMPTGDGLLVRLMPVAPVPVDAMAGLCDAARRHGSGTVEVTARGSLQVRGLTPRSAPLFAAAVADLGIAVQEGVPVIAGLDDSDADLLAVELRRAIANARLDLCPKVSLVVDGDGPLHLDQLSADVRLRTAGSRHGVQSPGLRFYLGIAGDGPAGTTWLGTVTEKNAVSAVVDILRTIAAQGPAARAADVFGRAGAAGDATAVPPRRTPAEMIGRHMLHDGSIALGIGLSFGYTRAEELAELVRAAARHGAPTVRPAPDRVLLLTGMSAQGAHDIAAVAERLGFVVHSGDPRRRIAACPGAPSCASGLIPARTLASSLAPVLAPVQKPERSGAVVHISGCPKGCAHPAPAALTIVGTPQGCGIVHCGAARDTPRHYVDPARLGDEIARLAAKPMEAAHG